MIKKLLALVLCLALVVSLLPTSVFAVDDQTETIVTTQEEQLPEETPAVEETADEAADADLLEEGSEDDPAPEAEPADEVTVGEAAPEEDPAPVEGSEEEPASEADPEDETIVGELAPAEEPETEPEEDPAPVAAFADEPAPEEQPTEEPAIAPAEEPTQSLIDKEYSSEDQIVIVKGLLPENTLVYAQELGNSAKRGMLKSASRGAKSESIVEGDEVLNGLTSDDIAAFYDIKLSDGNEEIQPTEPVTVTINNVNLNGSKATVYHILEDADAIAKGIANGTVKPVTAGILFERTNDAAKAAAVEATGNSGVVYVETLTANVSNGTVEFIATSFSVYAIEDDGQLETPRRTYYFKDIQIAEGGSYSYVSYPFMNKAGETVDNQIIKNGDKLDPVPDPYHSGYRFQGWYIWDADNDTWGDEVVFDTAIALSITADESVEVRAKYENVYFITFHQTVKGDTEDIILTKKAVVADSDGNGTVLISDTLAPQPDDSHIFYGWYVGNATTPTVVYDNEHNVQTTNITVTGDTDLWPYFVEAYWLHYVAGESGSGAVYVESQFVLATESLSSLPTTTRKGYTFLGWYRGSMGEDGKITYGEQITDGTGTVINPSTGLKLTEETTLYGNWQADTNAKYSVVIWAQKVTDSKTATNAQKKYDYVTSYSRTGTTGDPASASDADKNFPAVSGMDWTGFNYSRTVQNDTTIRANGSTVVNVYYDRDLKTINFYYQNSHAPEGAEPAYDYTVTTSDNEVPQQYGVLEDGSYIELHRTDPTVTTRVFYTYTHGIFQTESEYDGTFYTRRSLGWGRYEYTATQYNGNNLPPDNGVEYWTSDLGAWTNDGHYRLTRHTETNTSYSWVYEINGVQYPYTGTRYTRTPKSGFVMVTWTGLYGQSFDQNGYEWDSRYRWNEEQNGGGTTQTFLTGFTKTEDPYNLYDQGIAGTSYVIYHYKQGLDGKYSQSAGLRYTAYGNGGSFHFENKFDGFVVKSYNTGNNGFNTNGGSYTNMSNTPSTYPLHVYHQRNAWSITYMSQAPNSTSWDTVHEETDIYYEQPLTVFDDEDNIVDTFNLSLEEVGLSEREHYSFAGWFADETCTTAYDFSGTMPNANVVVYAKWEPNYYQINVDPDGGVFVAQNNATYLWLGYGEILGQYSATRLYIEDPDGDYVYRYVTFNGIEGNAYGPEPNDDEQGLRPADVLRKAQYIPASEILNDDGTLKAWDGDGQYKNVLLHYDQIYHYTDTTKRYSLIDPAQDPTYTLIGWYEVLDPGTENERMSDTPFDFSEEISRPITIRAKWHLGGKYQLQYTASRNNIPAGDDYISVAATCSQDEASYADSAKTIILGAPTLTGNEPVVFDGWEVVIIKGDGTITVLDNNNGNYYQPGDEFTVHGTQSVNKVIHLLAHYTYAPESNDPVPVTKLIFDANGGTTTLTSTTGLAVNDAKTVATYSPLQINSRFDLATNKDYFEREGYTLKGWNHVKSAADAGSVEFKFTTVVGMDNLEDSANTLYAVWEENTVTITYTIKILPADAGTVKLQGTTTTAATVSEEIPAVTGTPVGAVSAANVPAAYEFKGWFTNENGTGTPVATTETFTPTKAADATVWTDADYYAVYEEKKITINYVAVGPAGTTPTEFGTVDSISEQLFILTNSTATGSTAAAASDNYRFIGWYKDLACTQEVTETGWVNGTKITPSKADTDLWPADGVTYYALFDYNYTTLTITKAGSDAKDLGQAFLFRIQGVSGTNTAGIDITVSVKGNSSVVIGNLLIGKYTVTELTDWSWRYSYVSAKFNGATVASNGAEIELLSKQSPETNTLEVTNSRINPYWLGGDDYKVNNFTAPATTTGEAILPEPIRIKHGGQPVEA